MPQGWRPTHPGDPTPGLSKAGRLVIMIAVAVGVAIALMVIAVRPADASDALASTTMSQQPSPEPPPWFGGRVEMPEHGFAVTLPDDWVAFETGVDVAGQVEAASDVLDPSVYSPDGSDFTSLHSPSEDVQLSAFHATSLNTCGIGIYPLGEETPLGDVAEFFYERYMDSPAYRDVEPPGAIGLPVEAAYLVSTSVLFDPDADTWGAASLYLLGADERMVGVACTTDTRPDDDWLSIVETIEFLATEE